MPVTVTRNTGTSSDTLGKTFSVLPDAPISDADRVVVAAACPSGTTETTLSIADSQSHAWTEDAHTATLIAGSQTLAVFSAPNVTLSTSDTITVTSDVSTYLTVLVLVLDAGGRPVSVDTSSVGSGNGLEYAVASFTPTDGALVVNAVAAAYLALVDDFAPGVGWTEIPGVASSVGRSAVAQATTSDGTATTADCHGQNTHPWASIAVSYLSAGPAAGFYVHNGVDWERHTPHLSDGSSWQSVDVAAT